MRGVTFGLLAGVVWGATSAQIVAAADMPVKAPPLPVWSWSGVYAGINVGGSIGVNSDTQAATFSAPVLGANGLLNTSDKHASPGIVLGGQLGYNWQLSPRWLVGVEADWQWTSQKNSSTACSPEAATLAFFGFGASGFGYCLRNENRLTNFGTARGRGGVLVKDTLFYATGGVAWGTVKDNFAFGGTANQTVFGGALAVGPFLTSGASFTKTKVGWTVGVGAETKLDSRWSAKLEYLYVDLGTVSETFGIPINPAFGPLFTAGTASATRSSHITDNIVRVGLNYNFFAPVAPGPDYAAALPVAPPLPVWSWSGVYAGINVGGSIGVNSDTQAATFSAPVLGTNGLLNTSDKHASPGIVLGGQLGYNWQLSPRWLVGVEADWQWTSQKNSSTACSPEAATAAFFGTGASGFGYCLRNENKLTNFGTARARGGVLVKDTLFYATGGVAWGTVKDNFAYGGTANQAVFAGPLALGQFLTSGASFTKTKVGWTVGVGAETKLDSRWSAKLEYLYVDLGTVSETFGIPINPAFGPLFIAGTSSATRSSHITDNIVRVGLNYKIF